VRPFSVTTRADELAHAAREGVDVLVVGLGATGAGVALDAAARGMSVLAVDKGDLAAGTSSKSSKLVHGGLRYLENLELALVHEGVTERQVLLRLAPHLVRPMDFVYPVWPDTHKRLLLGLGLATYDAFALASVGARRSSVRRHRKITPLEAVGLAPALARSSMTGAYVYGDSATDDARLVLAVTQQARAFGALTVSYAEVVGLLLDRGRVSGARFADGTEVRARHVVNATGVWVDRLMGTADPGTAPIIAPSKGVHVVVPHDRLPLDRAAVLLPSKQGDDRSMFAIPWGRQSILGTTDTAYGGSLEAVALEREDLDYVLAAGNAVFHTGLEPGDVLGAWAGVRPLLRGAGDSMSDLSRRHTILEGASGLVSITGGKLTTYRRMAADVVDLLVQRDGRDAPCRTDEIPLGCTRPFDQVLADARIAAASVGVSEDTAVVLVRQHGDAAPDVLGLIASDPTLGEPLSPHSDHVFAEVVHAARHEGAATLDDVLSRRTRVSLRERDAGLSGAWRAASLLGAELGRPPAWAHQQVVEYVAAVRRERGVLGGGLGVADPLSASGDAGGDDPPAQAGDGPAGDGLHGGALTR
jgi:glycerol-3-phosphate dehydrogenase